jgi:hypothetical protein
MGWGVIYHATFNFFLAFCLFFTLNFLLSENFFIAFVDPFSIDKGTNFKKKLTQN